MLFVKLYRYADITWLTPWRRIILEKLIAAQTVKKFPALAILNPKVYYRVDKGQSPVLRQMNSVHNLIPYYF
jgi:hypothetical protein